MDTEKFRHYGLAVGAYRDVCGMDLHLLSAQSSITVPTIMEIEKGKGKYKLADVINLADKLGLTFDELEQLANTSKSLLAERKGKSLNSRDQRNLYYQLLIAVCDMYDNKMNQAENVKSIS